jgi:hypothetical protein
MSMVVFCEHVNNVGSKVNTPYLLDFYLIGEHLVVIMQPDK